MATEPTDAPGTHRSVRRTGTPGGDDERVAIHGSALKALPMLLFLGLPLLVVGVVLVVGFFRNEHGWGWLVAGVVMVWLAVTGVGNLVLPAFTGRPAVVLDRDGVHVKASFGSRHRIAWADVRSVDVYHPWAAGQGPQVEIEVERRGLAGHGPGERVLSFLNGALRRKGSTVYIPQLVLGLGYPADALAGEIERFRAGVERSPSARG